MSFKFRSIAVRAIVGLWVATVGGILVAQSPSADSLEIPDTQFARRSLQQGQYLKALTEFESFDNHHPIVQQEIATLRSFVSDHQGALVAMDSQGQIPDHDDPDLLAKLETATRLNALEAIVTAARDRQIVILNEAHHVPQHRAFGLQVAQRLRDMGFQYLAMETLSPFSEKTLVTRGFPVRLSGYYSQEPVFGEFIRHSLKLGYRPIAYEAILPPDNKLDQTDQVNHRESQQCKNLMNKIFQQDPQAKVLIYVGYSHATEDTQTLPDGREYAWMAARLKKATGLDPLTIDQTIQMEHGTLENSTNCWQLAQSKKWLDEPTVFQNADRNFLVAGQYAGKVDLQVFHPATKLVQGRADWLLTLPERQSIEIPAEIAATKSRVLLQAFLAHEPAEAIPVDQIILDPKLPNPALVLPSGEIRLVVQDETGHVVMERSILVPVPKTEVR